jgi:prevent-host-death family protein
MAIIIDIQKWEVSTLKFITVTELKAQALRVVSAINDTGEEVIITKNGKPVVLMRPVSEGEFELKLERKERDTLGKRNLQKR